MPQISPLKKYLASASFWASTGQILGTLFSFANMAVLSRIISPEEMGNYLLILSVVVMTSLFGMFGLPETMMRNTAKLIGINNQAQAKATIHATIALVGIFSLVTALIVFISPIADSLERTFNLELIGYVSLLVLAWVVLHCVHTTEIHVFRGLQDIFRASIFGQSMRGGLTLLTLIVLNANSAVNNAADAILANCIALSIVVVIAGMSLRKKAQTLCYSDDKWPTRQLLWQAIPFLVDGVIYQAFLRVGIWLLGYHVTKSDVALYGAAVQMVTLIMFPMQILNSLLPPFIANRYGKEKDNKSLQSIIRTVTTVVSVPSTLVTILFVVWGGKILSLVFGEFYGNGHMILAVLSIGYLSNIVFGPAGFLLKMTFHQTDLLKINLVASLLTILPAAYVAKNHTPESVAIVFAASMVLKNIYTFATAYRKTGILPALLVRPAQHRTLLVELRAFVVQLLQSR